MLVSHGQNSRCSRFVHKRLAACHYSSGKTAVEILAPVFRRGLGVSNIRNSANWNCARLRKLQWRVEHFSTSPHLGPATTVPLGVFRIQTPRTFGRTPCTESSVSHPITQPKAEVANTRISRPECMGAQRTGLFSSTALRLKRYCLFSAEVKAPVLS
jgi:hypothetical protein